MGETHQSSTDTLAVSNGPGGMLRSSLHQSLDLHTHILAGFVLYWHYVDT